MIMPNGIANRVVTSAFLGLVLCASPGFGQRLPNRQTPAPKTDAASRRKPGVELAPNRYIVFLQDEPVSTRYAAREQLTTAAAVAYRQQIESKQQSMMQDLSARKIQVAGSVTTLLNAIFVVTTADRVPELRGMPGVLGVMQERVMRTSLNRAITLANAQAAWAQAGIGGQANAGAGIKIAILDSGIDQTNPAFSDTGFTLPSGFPKCNVTSDCTNFTNKKVIVARSYVPMIAAGTSNSAATSEPDDTSARDHLGHGSAVASVAAAVQTTAGSLPFSGMAPAAYLGSYKVYGTPSVNDFPSEGVYIKALEDAMTDGMNIVNLSSGFLAIAGPLDTTQCGNAAGVPCDPIAQAFETAAQAGLVITVSAGNEGSWSNYYYGGQYPGFNTITSPSDAPSVISVGATVNSHVMNPSVSVNATGAASNLKGIVAALGDGGFYPALQGAFAAPIVDVTKLDPTGLACSALPAASLTDKFVLIQRGTCTFDVKAQNATAAGAIGVIFYMADSSALIAPGGTCNDNYSTGGNCDLNGPSVMISLADGQNLKTYIDANPSAVVTIDTAGAEQLLTATVNSLASYTSFGPSITGAIKPDMVATGGFDIFQSTYPSSTHGMYMAGETYDPNGDLFTSNGFVAADGTSFASPMVAGAAALVKQAHPTWSSLQIKSALVNNSAQDVTQDDFGDAVDTEWIGAGRLDANAAVGATVTAVPSTLSFGYLKAGVALPSPIPVTITNGGKVSITLAVAVTVGVPATGATVSVDHTSLTINAGATATLNVTLAGSVPAGGEYNGVVTLTSASPAAALHIPYMFLVGDSSAPSLVPLNLDILEGYYLYGSVSQDLGPIPFQVVDSWGVPVVGTAVTFTVTPRGAVTLKPVPGAAGATTNTSVAAGSTVPFVPSNCSPNSSTTSVSCTTNSYGIVWIDIVTGSTVYDLYSNPATIDAVSNLANEDITVYVGTIPAPKLTQVTDAAAFGSTIAPGSYVSLFGTGLLDPDSGSGSPDASFTQNRLPLVYGGVTVSFDSASCDSAAVSAPGYVYYVSQTQVNVYAPWELKDCPSAQMKVTLSESIQSNVLTVPVSNYVPAFLMYNSGSVFIADAIDPNCPNPYIVGTSCPAARGDLVEFYVNGLGPVTNQPASGNPALSSPLSYTTTNPVVMIGGQQATVQFAGLAPGFVGLYQVNAVIPTGISTGNQPVTIAIGGKTSPSSITSGSTTYNIVLPIK